MVEGDAPKPWSMSHVDWPKGGAIAAVWNHKLWTCISQAPFDVQTWNLCPRMTLLTMNKFASRTYNFRLCRFSAILNFVKNTKNLSPPRDFDRSAWNPVIHNLGTDTYNSISAKVEKVKEIKNYEPMKIAGGVALHINGCNFLRGVSNTTAIGIYVRRYNLRLRMHYWSNETKWGR